MSSFNANRTAIVTGAAGDLGKPIAIRLAEEGYRVAITDMESRRVDLQLTADAIAKTGSKCFLITGDVTKEEDVQNIVSETVKNLGRLDVMVSNAGKFKASPIINLSTGDWDDIFNVNVKGMMLCYKTAANQMLKQQAEDKNREAHYRIIGACSVGGLLGIPLGGAYNASKFAVRGLTKVAAAELGPSGITVNAYAPGIIGGSKMMEESAITVPPLLNISESVWRSHAINSTQLKKFGEAKHVAAMVSYLASRDAEWTTGQIFAVDGGMYMA